MMNKNLDIVNEKILDKNRNIKKGIYKRLEVDNYILKNKIKELNDFYDVYQFCDIYYLRKVNKLINELNAIRNEIVDTLNNWGMNE